MQEDWRIKSLVLRRLYYHSSFSPLLPPFNPIDRFIVSHRFCVPRVFKFHTRRGAISSKGTHDFLFPRRGTKNSKDESRSRTIFHGGRGNTSGAVPERLISKWRHLSVEADTYVLPGFRPTAGWCARRGWSGCLLVSSTRKDRRLLREQRKKCTFLLSTAREKRAEKYSPRIISCNERW